VEIGDLVKFKMLVLHKGWGSEWQWKMCIGHITGADYSTGREVFYEITDSLGERHMVPVKDIQILETKNESW
jgi:hypothetical protein